MEHVVVASRGSRARVAATCGGVSRASPRAQATQSPTPPGLPPALHPRFPEPDSEPGRVIDHLGPNTRPAVPNAAHPAWPEAPTVSLLSHGSGWRVRGCWPGEGGAQWHPRTESGLTTCVTPSASLGYLTRLSPPA